MAKYYIGWDVGAWHCDYNPNSRDAIYTLKDEETIASIKPFWGNLKDVILNESDVLSFLNSLYKEENFAFVTDDHITLAIDTPLGFPKAFRELIEERKVLFENSKGPKNFKYQENPYLFRKTERYLAANFKKEGESVQPLSAVQHMIGAQATKGMHFLKHFNFECKSTGIWESGNVKAIEVYPATCTLEHNKYDNPKRICVFRKNQGLREVDFYKAAKDDIKDAYIAARLAQDFEKYQLDAHMQEQVDFYEPCEDVPMEEGWIWVRK